MWLFPPETSLRTAHVGMEPHGQREERSMRVAGLVPGIPLYTKVRRKTKLSCAIIPSPFHPPGGHTYPPDSFLTIKKKKLLKTRRPILVARANIWAEANLIMGGKSGPPFWPHLWPPRQQIRWEVAGPRPYLASTENRKFNPFLVFQDRDYSHKQ